MKTYFSFFLVVCFFDQTNLPAQSFNSADPASINCDQICPAHSIFAPKTAIAKLQGFTTNHIPGQ